MSAEHLQLFAAEIGLPEDLLLSEYQHRLLQAKRANPLTRAWSNPEFMRFLYQTYIPNTIKCFILSGSPGRSVIGG